MSKKKTLAKSNETKQNSKKYSLIKTYGIIGGLILLYFFTTFSYKSVDKKMDKLAEVNTNIVLKENVNDDIVVLSTADNFIGITECSKLPLGRLSLKASNSKALEENDVKIISYKLKNKNTLILAGTNSNYKQVIFSDIIESNGTSTNTDITIDIPDEDNFILSATYHDDFTNIRLVKDNGEITSL